MLVRVLKQITSIVALVMLSVTAGSAFAAEDIVAAPAFSVAELTSPQDDGWITNGGTLSNQRYSPLNLINKDNVANLKGVWRTGLDSALEFRHNNQAQPLVFEGIIYIVTSQDDVFALSVDTGEILWEYRSGLTPDDAFVCCGWVSRGLGLGEGKVYLGRVDAKLMALDQKTGEVVWEIQDADPFAGYSLTSAPLYYDGMVITGYSGGDLGTRGRVKAYDVDDGAEIWTFYTIPGPGEFGHDTWPQDNDVWQWGGAPVWHTPALDPELGMLYFSTGNAGPVLGGGVRPGDNLFTASILAVDVYTGEYRWHFQEVHHDIWDYDAPNPIILFEAEYDGEMRKGLAHAGKTGWVYILDRITGEPLIGIEEREVPQEPRQATSPTQPYVIGDALVAHDVKYAPEDYDLVNEGRIFTPFYETTVFTPLAGVNWPPSAYDPETNSMFICASDSANAARADASQFEAPTFEGQFLGGAYVGAGLQSRGVYSAIDLKTNKLVWQRQFNDGCRSGSLATGGGLVFMGRRNDDRIVALDTATGDRLWEFRMDAPANSGVTTFMHKGEQHIVTYAGGGLFGGKKGDGVWLFSLNGNLNEVPAGQGAGGLRGPAPLPALNVPEGREADVANGKTIYSQSCVYCHGDTGEGGHGGGAELTSALEVADIMEVLSNGRNGMPPFSLVFSSEQAHDVANYLTAELLAE
ncbi:MAG: PQQ-binding-like beta-propeller repeat protein [Gammaproteobacteria bacterium]|nr:PQQ-binding-like beta-propeller repeat protein [Gammaproteobacteria bacterium]